MLTVTKRSQKVKKIRYYDKYSTSIDFNIFSSALFDERLKQAKFSASINPNTVDQRTIKVDMKIEKLHTFELGYFLGLIFFGDVVFQNMFVCPPTFRTFVLKKRKRH